MFYPQVLKMQLFDISDQLHINITKSNASVVDAMQCDSTGPTLSADR